MNLMIIFEGLFKRKDVDIEEGYNQFIFNRLLCQIDDGRYANKILKLTELGEMPDDIHFEYLKDIIPKGYHKTWNKPHIFALTIEYNQLIEYAGYVKQDVREYFTYWYSLSEPAKKREKALMADYKKKTTLK